MSELRKSRESTRSCAERAPSLLSAGPRFVEQPARGEHTAVLVCSAPALKREENENEDRTEPMAQDSTHATAGRWRATTQTWGRMAYAAAGEPAPVAFGPFICLPKPVPNEHYEQRTTPFTNARTGKRGDLKIIRIQLKSKGLAPTLCTDQI